MCGYDGSGIVHFNNEKVMIEKYRITVRRSSRKGHIMKRGVFVFTVPSNSSPEEMARLKFYISQELEKTSAIIVLYDNVKFNYYPV